MAGARRWGKRSRRTLTPDPERESALPFPAFLRTPLKLARPRGVSGRARSGTLPALLGIRSATLAGGATSPSLIGRRSGALLRRPRDSGSLTFLPAALCGHPLAGFPTERCLYGQCQGALPTPRRPCARRPCSHQEMAGVGRLGLGPSGPTGTTQRPSTRGAGAHAGGD